MLRELLAASLLLLLVATGFSAAAPAVSPSMVSWRAQLPVENVSLGSPVQVIVYGPPNGTFNVTVSGAPPLSSVIFFDQNYTLPSAAANATLGASTIVSIPTGGLAYGPYSLAVYNESLGFEFSAFYVHLVPGVNSTYLVGQLLYLEELYNVTLLRELGLSGQIAKEQNMVRYLVGALVAVVIGCVLAVAYVKTGDAWGSIGRGIEKARGTVHDFFNSAPNSDPYRYGGYPNAHPTADTEAVYVSHAYPKCQVCRTPDRHAAVVKHLRMDHRVPEAAGAKLVVPSTAERLRMAHAKEAAEPKVSEKAMRRALRDLPPITEGRG